MNAPVSVMQTNTVADQTTTPILENLPDPPGFSGEGCPRRARMQIDLLLLAIEALDLHGSQAILAVAKEEQLQGVIQNRVFLWILRSTNPLRRFSQRRALKLQEGKALVAIASILATRRLKTTIRQLLADYEQLQQKQIPLEHHLRLSNYLERFRAHFRSRMNPRRAGVVAYSTNEKLNALAIELLGELLFCTGTAGMQRLWFSLFDGEVE
ncbi:DUF3038 domain-containing protein [Phormidium sp. CCY1219]|uniref:DUF3038 domain-containing protein n=1 Tax=Phormidium sp. CCY1219 TaxID=2886104 RepID=UPI002D771008|nr:DUF3038 domain-containing protein [Phormidium sp. CCY1219]